MRLRVTLVEGPDRDQTVEQVADRLAVGTSSDNELVLTDPMVSGHHLQLACEDGILVKDLGSESGTFVGDVRIHEAVVPLGTRVRLGTTVLAVSGVGADPLAAGAPRPYRAARAEALATFERRYLLQLIEATGGNASAAARVANMDRPYLLTLLRKHGLR